MKSQTIYIFHKNGADTHYTALKELLRNNSGTLEYREFSVISKTWKALKNFDLVSLKKQWVNLKFMISLLFSTNKKIVLGIAPYDFKIGFLLKLLKHHDVYYHTSWICWDKSFHPKRKFNSTKVFAQWKYFLEKKTSAIFCVTHKSKEELLKNYDLGGKNIQVVYHSVEKPFENYLQETKKSNSFIYVGRLVKQKGIEEILDYFSSNPELSITLIGGGPLNEKVENFATKYHNITHKGYINDKHLIAEEFSKHEFFILNSQKSGRWEELFGMVLIESMSQGVIPVSSALTGPKEIIEDGKNGLLFLEGEMKTALKRIKKGKLDKQKIIQNAVETSRYYFRQNISKNWQPILK